MQVSSQHNIHEYLKGKVPHLLPVDYTMLWMMNPLIVSHLYHDPTIYDLMSMGYYYDHYCYQQIMFEPMNPFYWSMMMMM
jgi:hypothetical protein